MNEIALNYANALFSIAKEENKISLWHSQSKLLLDIINDNEEVVLLLGSHFLSLEERKNNAQKLFKDFEVEIVNLIKVIIDYHRLSYLTEILETFVSLCNQSFGIKEGLLYSAFTLDKATVTQIEDKISQIEKCRVSLRTRIDPSLIGGVKVVIAGHVYDDSIQNQLEKMQTKLLAKGERPYEN